jgi:hypothetical protein
MAWGIITPGHLSMLRRLATMVSHETSPDHQGTQRFYTDAITATNSKTRGPAA